MRADPTWPNRARYSIPCDVTLGSAGGAARLEPSRGSGACGAGPRERLSVFCRVFSLSVSLLFLFHLFVVLLNCPYPDPPVFCLFSFHSPPHRGGGEGRPRGAFVAGGNQNQNTVAVTRRCADVQTCLTIRKANVLLPFSFRTASFPGRRLTCSWNNNCH